MGRRAHQATDETRKLVEQLAGVGLPHEMICSIVGVKKKDTLYVHYREELDRGKARACAAVGKMLFKKCMDGDTASILFWCKTQMGFRETERHEVTGADGKPLEVTRIELVAPNVHAKN